MCSAPPPNLPVAPGHPGSESAAISLRGTINEMVDITDDVPLSSGTDITITSKTRCILDLILPVLLQPAPHPVTGEEGVKLISSPTVGQACRRDRSGPSGFSSAAAPDRRLPEQFLENV